MTAVEDQYHSDSSGDARPAINVKCYAAGRAFWPDLSRSIERIGARVAPDLDLAEHVDTAYARVQSDFWQAAQEIAEQRGLGDVEQQGRSGGWLVFTDGRDPRDMHSSAEPPYSATERREWLAAYRAMVEWAEAYIADAPRKVRELAQGLAMDQAGEGAARRMFGRAA